MYRKIDYKYLLIGITASFIFAGLFTLLGRVDFLLTGVDNFIDAAESMLDTKLKVQILAGISLFLNSLPLIIIPSRSYKALRGWIFLLLPLYIILSGSAYYLHIIVTVLISYGLFFINWLADKNNFKHIQFIGSSIVINIITLILEFTTGWIKMALLPINIMALGEIRRIFICIDYFACLAIFIKYAYERRNSNESIFGCYRKSWLLDKLLVLRRSQGVQACKQVKHSNTEQISLTRTERIFMLSMQPIQIILVSVCMAISNRLFVFFILFFAGFLPQKMHKKHTIAYHAGEGKWYACLFQTILVFYMLCVAIPIQHLSFVLPAIVGSIAWLYTVKLEILRQGKRTVHTASSEDIEDALKCVTFDASYHRQICELLWLQGKTIHETAELVQYSDSQVCKIKERYRSIVETYL